LDFVSWAPVKLGKLIPQIRMATELAMGEFAVRWRLWLEWAGLREIDDKERRSVRLP
jgi:hypothetical protein